MLAVTEPTSPLRPAPAAARVVVAIPALNEEDSIASVVAGIPRALASRVTYVAGNAVKRAGRFVLVLEVDINVALFGEC